MTQGRLNQLQDHTNVPSMCKPACILHVMPSNPRHTCAGALCFTVSKCLSTSALCLKSCELRNRIGSQQLDQRLVIEQNMFVIAVSCSNSPLDFGVFSRLDVEASIKGQHRYVRRRVLIRPEVLVTCERSVLWK